MKKLKPIIVSAFAAVLALSPVTKVFAAYPGDTESSLKDALYALAFYDCIDQYGYSLQETAIGNAITSIMQSPENYNVFVGTWVSGDSTGTVSCKDVIEHVFVTDKITASLLGDESGSGNGIFNGVYTRNVEAEKRISCHYQIINSEATATINNGHQYTWPQGFYEKTTVGGVTSLVDVTSHDPVYIVFDENGPIKAEGGISDINTTRLIESLRNMIIHWDDESKICQPLVQYGEVFEDYTGPNPLGDTITTYTPIKSSTDGAPFHEWGIHVDDSNCAWIHSNDDKFQHTVTVNNTSNKITPTDNAQAKLKENISRIYLDGATTLDEYLTKYPDAAYILYGRYLFNGDGAYEAGCNGVTVSKSDENFSSLPSQYWDSSLSYVANISAFDNTGNRSDFLTKFGGNGLKQAGQDRNVTLPGGYGTQLNCKELASKFNGITPTNDTAKTTVWGYMKVSAVSELPEENNNVTPGDGKNSVSCYNSTSLGWILCPVLDLVNAAVDGLYGMVEGQLEVETDLVGSSNAGGSGTYQGWKVFQNFANILVIALLLFVIFSQVTGVGIDNYGIKKTLPKLIIAAVLVNLSFAVCQLCADLSNLLGVNLRSMFESFAGSVTTDSSVKVFTGVVSTLLTGGVLTGLGFLAYFTWEFWLIPVLLAAVGLLISILFFFILLSVRKAFIIVFIVIAPLALACYMLPNTKKWFDKWVKGFGAMLLVYPICGLAMGAGTWISKLLMKTANEGGEGGFLFFLVAALMNVIPFFFIPTLLKNGLAAIGAIGGKIAGMGDKLSGSVKRGLGNAEATKDAQRRLGMRHNLGVVNRLQAKLDKNGKLNGYQKRRMNNARLAYNKAAKEDLDAEAGGVLLTPGSTGYDAYLKAQESAQSKQNLDNEVARMGDETNNYNPDVMNKQLKDIMNREQQGKLTPDEELHMRALMYKMATGSGYSKKALAKTVANGTNAEARSAAAKFMSKNGEVASAINSKDLGAGQYLREVNSGQASTDFATWQNTTRDDGMTNAQFVLSKVITDNGDFMGQSASVVASELGMKEVVGADGQVSYVRDDQAVAANIVSDDRLKDMLKSDLALESADSDVRRAILSAAKVRGIAIPQKWSDTPAPAPNPQPQGGRGGRRGKKKRRRMQPGDSGDSGSFH